MMKFIFFLPGVLAMIYEVTVLLGNAARVSRVVNRIKNRKDTDKRTELLFAVMMMLYVIWTFLGLLSSQWLLFGVFIILSLIPKPWIWLRWIDALVSIVLLAFIMINAFHLHIDMWQWLRSNIL